MKYADKLKAHLREHPPGEFKTIWCSNCKAPRKHKLQGTCHYLDGIIQWWGNCLSCGAANDSKRKAAGQAKQPAPPPNGQQRLGDGLLPKAEVRWA